MGQYLQLTDLGHSDLKVLTAGFFPCSPKDSYGPVVHNRYCVQYVMSGKGYFQCNGITYHLSQHELFLIRPDDIVYYEADETNPWTRVNLAFMGIIAKELIVGILDDPGQRVFFSKECAAVFAEVPRVFEMEHGKELYLLSILYRFFSYMTKKPLSLTQRYVSKAAAIITSNISRLDGGVVRVEDIARQVGVDRKYLSKLFKQEYGLSLQEYIMKTKMNAAKSLLQNTAIRISDIASTLGYNDQLTFTKMFKKYYGCSPRAFRDKKQQ